MERCKSGRPLRAKYDGLLYLLGDTYRVIDLKNRLDRFVTEQSLNKRLGNQKWNCIRHKIQMDGFYESGQYRIETWDRSGGA